MLVELVSECGISPEKLPYTFAGLCLQEPMALITNWLIATICFVCYYNLGKPESEFEKYWKGFYMLFGLSTVFGGLGHTFFYYTDIYGKFPCWTLGILTSFYAGKAMISLYNPLRKKLLTRILIAKAVILWVLAIALKSFLFVTVDAVVAYLIFCGGFGVYFWKKGMEGFKYIVFGVVILIPSAFIFLLKLNPHIWFNKDDLSHVLMMITITFFYFGIRFMANYFKENNTFNVLK
ncbi:hypothetical protein SAMN05216474_2031 [Lishizhenia tianjinensis]|uniref:Uncharacterized protein n=1 Tax=Lishizhenia tianjinensis TaxID=477690 RepID=A0A1I7AFA2_9FLAO|nr:hypothetical protein [Lishizhenia tianjinensis]SFT73593.1 hypothetical protein SAMN05216474_2031 [Lishizhenia tianjinensis]